MADFKQQLLNLLAATNVNAAAVGGGVGTVLPANNTTIITDTQEQLIPNADGSSIVLQQRKEVERQIKTLAPQLDFTSIDFCPGEQIKLITKLQLLPGIPYNVEKLDYRTIKNTKCLIATAQTNFGAEVPDQGDFQLKIEMTISNKWSKIVASVVGTDNAKYVVCRTLRHGKQKFNDKRATQQ